MMAQKTTKTSKSFLKIILLAVGGVILLGIMVFAVLPRLTEPSWGKIQQMMEQTDPSEDSGRLVISDKDKERISSSNLEGKAELTDVSGAGASGKVYEDFADGKYSFYGEFEGLPALLPGQFYQVWVVRDNPFEYIPVGIVIVTDSGSYQVSYVGADTIDWQEVAKRAAADPASYDKFLRGAAQDLTQRWSVEAETGIDGLGKMRVFYGSGTDLTSYDRVVLTQEEADGNPRPGKFMLQGTVNSVASTNINLQFPIIYTQKDGEIVKGTEKCPAHVEESNLVFCSETKEQAIQALNDWNAGSLKGPDGQYKTPTPTTKTVDLSGRWGIEGGEIIEITHSGNNIQAVIVEGFQRWIGEVSFSGKLTGNSFVGTKLFLGRERCPDFRMTRPATGTLSSDGKTLSVTAVVPRYRISDCVYVYDDGKATANFKKL